MQRRRLSEGNRESRLWDGWLESLMILGLSLYTAGVDILEGGKLTSNNVGGAVRRPFAELAIASGAVSKPGGDTAGQDALHSAGVEGSEDSGARSKLPQPSQEEETLMCLLQHCICVSRPCEILGDVNAAELKAGHPLHRCLVDGDGCVFSALSPVIHTSSCLVDVEWEVVLLAPFSQGTHLLSVGRLTLSVIRPITVVSSANLTMTLELCVAVQSCVYREYRSGLRTQPSCTEICSVLESGASQPVWQAL